MTDEISKFIRVGTDYYKHVLRPTISGDKVPELIKWNAQSIITDFGRKEIDSIPKYDGFCNIPNHIDYQQTINNFYNIYEQIPYKIQRVIDQSLDEQKSQVPYSIQFIKHIFQGQYELGLDYIKILLEYPCQPLPILCLVSKLRSTGKSTFIKWIRNLFGKNVTYLKGDTFASQFNSDWAGKLVVAVDEVFFDKKEITERLKYLSTTNRDKIEAKGRDRVEIEFFAKFILCSNNESNFIQIDKEEIRFWILQIPRIKKESVDFIQELNKEIPLFLNYIYTRTFASERKTRMWFTPQQIETPALQRLFKASNGAEEETICECLYELFENIDDNEVHITASDLYKLSPRGGNKIASISAQEIRLILKKWGLQPQNNSLKYSYYSISNTGQYLRKEKKGRYYTIDRNFILQINDAVMPDN